MLQTIVASLLLLAAAPAAASRFSLEQILSYPFPMSLVPSGDGRTIAYQIDQRGARSVWIARAPDYRPQRIANYANDDGQAVSSLQLSRDGTRLVYTHGNTQNPSLDVRQPQPHVVSVDTTTGTQVDLGEGYASAVSADGTRVAFLRDAVVWSAPATGSAPAARLFYDAGRDRDVQWSPNGDALAFVSERGDHAFIGIYRSNARPLQFLAPSTGNDTEPRWSPDGGSIVFARTPGAGGAVASPLAMPVVPWSIWIARVSDGAAHRVWSSGDSSRASFPTQGGDVDLTWLGNDAIAFLSETDGWPHIYVVGAPGGTARRLTSGAYAVISMAASRDGHSLEYVANTGALAGDIDRWHLFRVDARSGRVSAITRGTGSQWWPLPLDGGEIAYATTTAQMPPLVAVANADGTRERLVDAALIPSDFPASSLVTPNDVTYHASDGRLIHAQLFARRSIRRRPAVVFVHGGPMRQMLLTWSPMSYYANSYAVDQYLVNRGFAVLSVNYRTGTDYGHDFHYAVRAGWTGASEYQDVLAGARWLQQQPSIDPNRIGIWGGSWGGYLTALALARNSDVFKAGVDYSGVHDLMHDAIAYFHAYGEGADNIDLRPWLKLAWNSSPEGALATWRSPVLLIQGDQDPDVEFHQTVDLGSAATSATHSTRRHRPARRGTHVLTLEFLAARGQRGSELPKGKSRPMSPANRAIYRAVEMRSSRR